MEKSLDIKTYLLYCLKKRRAMKKTTTLVQFICPNTDRENLVELKNGKSHSKTLTGELYDLPCLHCAEKHHQVEVQQPNQTNQIVFPPNINSFTNSSFHKP